MELSGHGSTIDTEVYLPSSGGAASNLRTGFPTILSRVAAISPPFIGSLVIDSLEYSKSV